MTNVFVNWEAPKSVAPASFLFEIDGVKYRETRDPGSDISDLPPDVQADVNAVWTTEYIADWQAKVAAQDARDKADGLEQRSKGVKAEAERRILKILPEYKQRNVIAKGLEMVLANGLDLSKWPEAEQRRATTALAQWSEIEKIRAKSDELEAMEPIPPDYRNDKYWT